MEESEALSGKFALVTGGSSGIGAACAGFLASHGATVMVGFNRGEARAEQVRAQLSGSGHSVRRVALDSGSDHAEVVNAIQRGSGRLDILVNSAGYTTRIPHGDVQALDPTLFNDILTANVGGTYAITRALIPLLQASGSATVVNVSSVSAFTASGSNIAYCAAKAGVDVLTTALGRAFGPSIRFLSVSPASVATEFVPGRSQDELKRKAADTPLKRVVTAEDVALAVLACVTHLRTATGTRIVIDGGASL